MRDVQGRTDFDFTAVLGGFADLARHAEQIGMCRAELKFMARRDDIRGYAKGKIMSSISLVTNTGIGASVSTAGGDNGSSISALQKQIAALLKELSSLQGSDSKEAIRRADLIQQQIQVLQARIAQLQKQQADAAAAKTATAPARESPGQRSETLGNEVDVFA
jgi:prefoldin subunit 5